MVKAHFHSAGMVLGLGLLMSATSSAAPGDKLYVKGNYVNVRSGPSLGATVILQLGQGHELIEFGRKGEWVNVGIARTGGKEGWVHQSLVSATFSGGKTTAPPNPAFSNFREAVMNLNQKVQRQTGYSFFTEVENLGDGIVQITATDIWLSGSQQERANNVSTLFDMWDAAEGTGLPIRVQVVDKAGNIIMSKSRP